MDAPEDSATPQHMNFDRLHEMSLGDRRFERDVLAQFMSELPDLLASTEGGLRAGDGAAAGRAAHSLMGSSRTVGADALGELMAEIEKLGKAGELVEARAALARAQAEVAELRSTLEHYLRDRAA